MNTGHVAGWARGSWLGRWSLRRSLEGGVAGSLATGLVGQLVLIASGILVARALGVEGRGQLAVIVLVPSVLSQLGTLGVPIALTYFIARDPQGGGTRLRSLTPLISAQIVGLTIAQVGILLLLVRDDERSAMLAAIPVMPALIAQQYGLAVLQGQQRFTLFNVLRVSPAALYALALAALVAVSRTDLVELVFAWTVANLIAGLALAAVAIDYARRPSGPSPDNRVGDFLRYGCSAILGSSSPAEILRFDQVVIAVSLSRTALGLYVVAVAFTNLPRFISQSVGMVAYPKIAAAKAAARELVHTYLVLVFIVAGIVVVLLEVTVRWLIPWLFGSDFQGAVTTAQILLVAAFLLAVRRVYQDVAQGLGNPISSSVAELVDLSVALPLIAIAAPLWGIEGAAVALTAGAAASLAVLGWMVRRTLVRGSSVDRSKGEVTGGELVKAMALGRGEASPCERSPAVPREPRATGRAVPWRLWQRCPATPSRAARSGSPWQAAPPGPGRSRMAALDRSPLAIRERRSLAWRLDDPPLPSAAGRIPDRSAVDRAADGASGPLDHCLRPPVSRRADRQILGGSSSPTKGNSGSCPWASPPARHCSPSAHACRPLEAIRPMPRSESPRASST